MRRAALCILCLPCACDPSFANDAWLVTSARVLAVKSEPPEAPPGTSVTYTAFVAGTTGASAANLAWAFCAAPKPPTEDNVVSAACLDRTALLTIGQGPSIVAATPRNACTLFGPNPPAAGLRPRDPDITGGYFQPLRVELPGADPTFYLERVECGIADAPLDIASEYGQRYVANQNPHLAALTASIDGTPASLAALPPGAHVDLESSWPGADAETYADFDRAAQRLVTRREALSVAWSVDGGNLTSEASAPGADGTETSAKNSWWAPSTPGTFTLYVVLRDSRGGSDFASYPLVVGP